ncbi:SIMPL domain-containing protein [Beijerinckia sp. L45]|uniref:SIMPL domain-containing protein n=1 Tax=Beijerinckia sp. L45 TaxID=1641855 RepID=UPI001FEE897E|nr:SIMPL domain-containing protein [Beijerinckia sp. L45]
MSKLPYATAAVALFLCGATAAQAQQADDDTNAIDDRPHITVIGTAAAQMVPDLAEISFGVITEKPGAAEASAENARVAESVIDAAKAQGVEARDIRTQAVTLTQVFDEIHDANGRFTGRKPRGFSAENTIAVRVRALDKAGALAQSLIGKGATQFNGISFSVEHPEPVQDRLLGEAVRDARRKAGIAAEALGVKLGPVLLIERPGADTGGAPVFAKGRMMAAMAPAPAVPVEAGTETLSSEMEVTWALEP